MINLRNYIKIMRLNQILRHIFIIPGMILGYYFAKKIPTLSEFFFAIFASILIASSNYIINEICDRKYDIHHELKKNRLIAKKKISLKEAYFLYFVTLGLGILIAKIFVNDFFFIISIIFFFSGLIYNVRPFRLKDIPIIDVVTESFNNPIRLLLGFSLFFEKIAIPSISLIVSYWFAGAFLMNSKRLSEVIFFKNKISKLKKYRTVYNFYNFQNLNCLSFLYGSTSLSILSIFIIKYRIEYILLLPILVLIFTFYHFYSTNHSEKMQNEKNLIKFTSLIILILFLFLSFLFLSFFQIDSLKILLDKNLIYLAK